jgi:hypothetical protein
MFPSPVECTPALWTILSLGACMVRTAICFCIHTEHPVTPGFVQFVYIAWKLLNMHQRIAYRHIPGARFACCDLRLRLPLTFLQVPSLCPSLATCRRCASTAR